MNITDWRETTYKEAFNNTVVYVKNMRKSDKSFSITDLEAMLQSEYDRQGQAWDGRGEVMELSIEATIAGMQQEIALWKKELMDIEKVVLVDENDDPVGEMAKMEAHEKALLHRAFSVFVFNNNDELMMQQRALGKYHSPGLWTNTCCSHPRPGETVLEAGHRRLLEEMGFDCTIEKIFDFIYKAQLDHGLTEHEFDHVLFGRYDQNPDINPVEVENWKWMAMDDIDEAMKKKPEQFTVWFRIAFERVFKHLKG
jgi:isopentenyl-diphosphate delta-isomerase